MTPPTPLVLAVIARRFPAEARERIAALLAERCGHDLPAIADGSGIERIRLAVLKLAGGDPAAVPAQVADARRDWRDVLVAAGFASDLTAHLRWAAATTC
jgi:hypothetical protein